mmetsp:Transcript_12027/g.15022  ORF Transcript_12027/g.15022 Transcript_12027/m.15022 type:complete len:114 (-) Transcript_12027:23-364(-)
MLGGSLYVLVYYLSGFWDGLFIRIMSKPEATGVNPNVNTVPGSDFKVNNDLTGNKGLEVKEASGGDFYDMKCDKKCDAKCTCPATCDCTNNPDCKCTFVKKNLETRPLTQTGK